MVGADGQPQPDRRVSTDRYGTAQSDAADLVDAAGLVAAAQPTGCSSTWWVASLWARSSSSCPPSSRRGSRDQ
jgi:hypothetical protein